MNLKKLEIIYRYIFSVIFFFVTINPFLAQDTLPAKKYIYLSVDVSKPLVNLIFNDSARAVNQYEFSFGLLPGEKFRPAMDIGYADAFFQKTNYNLDITGGYIKLGLEKGIMRDGSDLFAYGFRLAGSKYNISYENAFINDLYYNKLVIPMKSDSPFALWAESVLKLNIRVRGDFSIGWTARLKIPLYIQEDHYFKPYYIPGFGKTQRGAMLGFTYCLIYNIPY